MDIRCPYKLHGILVDKGIIEVKCDSRLCGAGNGVVVFHRFDLGTGDLINTVRYKQPGRTK